MTDEQYRLIYLQKHSINERWGLPLFTNALKAQLKPIEEYLNSGMISVLPFLIEQINPQPVYTALDRFYQHVGIKQARFEFYAIRRQEREEKASTVSFFVEHWQQLLTEFMRVYGAISVTQITDTTKEFLRNLLAYTQEQNMTTMEASRYIVAKMKSKDFLFNRALRIARTETTKISNYAHGVANEDSEIETQEKWIATEDHRTRRSHLIANGQVIDTGEMFVVGNTLMKYPGDPTAPAEEVVNCRCVRRFIPVYDANGLAVPRRR